MKQLRPDCGVQYHNTNCRQKSTHKGLNQRSTDVTQVQQQRPESPTVTLTWHACKYKVHKLHKRYIFSNIKEVPWWSLCTLGMFLSLFLERNTISSGRFFCFFVLLRNPVSLNLNFTSHNFGSVCVCVGGGGGELDELTSIHTLAVSPGFFPQKEEPPPILQLSLEDLLP